MNPINIGDRYRGSIDGVIYEVVDIRSDRAYVGLSPDYKLSYEKGKTHHTTESQIRWMLKSGGLIRINPT